MNLLFYSSRQSTAQSNLQKTKMGSRRQYPEESVARACCPTILVVDDDPSVGEILKAAINKWGYDMILASNGREGRKS